ncbi:hypothetical protein HK100_009084, partial [Physocladia obscura]
MDYIIPLEILELILVWIDPKHVLRYRRVSKVFNSFLLNRHFARANLQLHKSKYGTLNRESSIEPTDYDRCWFVWPKAYQEIYADIALKTLTLVFWGDQNIHGTIPRAIGRLQNLQQLYLHRNMLTGEIPAEIGELESLGTINFRHNRLRGNVPLIRFGNLRNLIFAYISAGNSLCNVASSSLSGVHETVCAVFRKDGILVEVLVG